MFLTPLSLCYVSPDQNLTFEQGDAPNLLKAISYQNRDKPLTVELPSSQYLCRSALSAAEKVARVLRNCLVRPQIDGQSVRFSDYLSVKGWEKAGSQIIQHQGGRALWIPRIDGSISYARGSSVITWDWRSGKSTIKHYNTTDITALAEMQDGKLVVGDSKGVLYFEDKIVPTAGKFIKKLQVISPDLVVVFFTNGDEIVVNHRTLHKSKMPEKNDNRLILVDGTILTLKEGNIIKYEFKQDQYVALETGLKGVKIFPVANSTTQFVIKDIDLSKVKIWDVSSNKTVEIKAECLGFLNQAKQVFLIDRQTLAFDDQSVKHALIHCCSASGEYTKIECTQFSKIYDMSLLSNNTFLCVSPIGYDDGHVFIVTFDQNIVWHQESHHLQDSKPSELVDGSVAFLCGTALQVINPKLEQSSKLINEQEYNRQKLLEEEIKQFPFHLELYNQYAASWNIYDQYRPYLAGMIASVRAGNFYLARRFYEKAKQSKGQQGDAQTAATVFLSYLRYVAEPKLARQVKLDLYRFIQDPNLLPQNREVKNRLLIGEGDFTYTQALINKHSQIHPTLANAITSTELNVPKDAKVLERCETLRLKGVKILFGVDGTTLHQFFAGRRFERIQWNCPFGNGGDRSNGFQEVIPKFFLSASHLQLVGDRIHVTLINQDARQIENPIVKGSTQAGYRLIRMRPFGSNRYPGYQHVMTDTNSKANGQYKGGGEEKEYVFEKVQINMRSEPTIEDAKKMSDPNVKNYRLLSGSEPDLKKCRFECSEDGDSSDYWE